jgi:myo-inositol catabolism protein IolC
MSDTTTPYDVAPDIDDRVLLILAADHCNSLERDLYGLSAPPTPAQAARITADKLLIYQALLDAAATLPPEVQPGVLMDDQYGDTKAVGGDSARYDVELRPGLTVETIRYLQDHGVEPDIWKVEGLDRHDDAVAVVDVARRDGRQADCIVLGRHAPHDKLDHWLEVAAPLPGFVGFAIGRSIWWDAVHAYLRHHCTGAEARHRIAAEYRDFANYYLSAGAVELTGAAQPEFC